MDSEWNNYKATVIGHTHITDMSSTFDYVITGNENLLYCIIHDTNSGIQTNMRWFPAWNNKLSNGMYNDGSTFHVTVTYDGKELTRGNADNKN